MPPKFAGKNGRRGGGAPFNPSRNSRYSADCTGKSQFHPQSHMPSKISDNQGRRIVAGRKIKQVWRPKPSPPPPWTELPRDITANILHRLGAVDILETAQKVCTTWHSVCKDPAMWRVIDMGNHGVLDDMGYESYDLQKMCRHAVDRSQGQLVDIDLKYFASEELLDYIATRSGKLRRLRLACCYALSSAGLIEAIKRFPELEELHLIQFFVSSEIVETVGRSCPLLRSFTFNTWACDIMGDENAMAIARSMPELRYLQLLGNSLTSEGLEAILNGCPHLETLDLRCCYHVKLKGDMGKRCSTQIKCLRYPDESISDNEFQVDDSECFAGYPYGFYSPDFLDYDDYDCDFEDYHLYYDDYVDDDSEFENFPIWYDD